MFFRGTALGLSQFAYMIDYFWNNPKTPQQEHKMLLKYGINSCKNGGFQNGLFYLNIAQQIEKKSDFFNVERALYSSLAQLKENKFESNHESLKMGLMAFPDPHSAFNDRYHNPIRNILLEINTKLRNKIVSLIQFKQNLPMCTGQKDFHTIIKNAKESEKNGKYLLAAFHYTESTRFEIQALKHEMYVARHCALIKTKLYHYNFGFDIVIAVWLAGNKKDAKSVIYKLQKQVKDNDCIENRIALMEFYLGFISWFELIGEGKKDFVKEFRTSAKELLLEASKILEDDKESLTVYNEYKNAVINSKPDCFSNKVKNDLLELYIQHDVIALDEKEIPPDENEYLTEALKYFDKKIWYEAADSFEKAKILNKSLINNLDCETLIKFCAVFIFLHQERKDDKTRNQADELLHFVFSHPAKIDFSTQYYNLVKEHYNKRYNITSIDTNVSKGYKYYLDLAIREENGKRFQQACDYYSAAITKDPYRFEAYAGKIYCAYMLGNKDNSSWYHKGMFYLLLTNNNLINQAFTFLKQRIEKNPNPARYFILMELYHGFFYRLALSDRIEEAARLKNDALNYAINKPVTQLDYKKELYDSELMNDSIHSCEKIICLLKDIPKIIDIDEDKKTILDKKLSTDKSIDEKTVITSNISLEIKSPNEPQKQAELLLSDLKQTKNKPNPFLKRKSSKKPHPPLKKITSEVPNDILFITSPAVHSIIRSPYSKKEELELDTPASKSKKQLLLEERAKRTKEILERQEQEDVKFTLDKLIRQVVIINDKEKEDELQKKYEQEKEHKKSLAHANSIISGLISNSIIIAENIVVIRNLQAKRLKEKLAILEASRVATAKSLFLLREQIQSEKKSLNSTIPKPYLVPVKRIKIPAELLTIAEFIYQFYKQFKIPIYLVGGVLRDLIRGVKFNDCDLVASASHSEIYDSISKFNLSNKIKFEISFLKKISSQNDFKKNNLSCSRLNALGKEFGKNWAITHNPNLKKGFLWDAVLRDLTQNAMHGAIIFDKNEYYVDIYDSLNLGYYHTLINCPQVIDENRLNQDGIYLLRLVSFLIRFNNNPTDEFKFMYTYYKNLINQFIRTNPMIFKEPLTNEDRLKVFITEKLLKIADKDPNFLKETGIIDYLPNNIGFNKIGHVKP